MRRAALVLAVGAVLLFLALRARRERPARPTAVPRPAPAVVELSTPAEEVEPEPPAPVPAPRVVPAPRPSSPQDVAPPAPAPKTAVWGVVTTLERPPRRSVKMDADARCVELHPDGILSDDFVVGPRGQVRWAVVRVVKGAARTPDPPKVPARMEMVGCRFDPHVLTVRSGQTVEFVNRDAFNHNARGLPFINFEFNVGLPPGGSFQKAFSRPEIFKVQDACFPWMSAWIAVSDHPFVTVTDEEGNFRLAGLPPGRYVIGTWHEQLSTATYELDVGDVDIRLDLVLQRR